MKNDFQIPTPWILHLRNSYQVLWERYRNEGRIHSTFLFTGTAGVGKRIAVLDFIKGIYCDSPLPDHSPCEICRSCARFRTKQILDHTWMEPEDSGTHKIEPFRELQTKLGLGPIEEPFYSCVIARADLMTSAAANSMLKTLEEPPKRWIFALTAQASDLLLPTIRSRTLEVRIPPIPEDLLYEILTVNHSSDCSLTQMKTASILGQGSYSQSLPYLDEDCWNLRQDWFGFLQDPAREWYPFFETVSKSDSNYVLTFDLIETFLWDCMQFRKNKKNHIKNTDQIEFLNDFCARHPELTDEVLFESFERLWNIRKGSNTPINLKTKTQNLLNVPLAILGLA